MIRNKANIVLVGFMGAGKSSVGRELARLTQRRFIDVDAWIEQNTGKTVREIFTEQGEASFRAQEVQAIQEISQAKDVVIAAGGGSIANPRNLSNLRKSGVIFFLNPPLDLLLERVFSDPSRPLAQLGRDKLVQLFRQRQSQYQLADYEISYDERTDIHGVAQKILQVFKTNQPTLVVKTSTKSYPYWLGQDFRWPEVISEELLAHSRKALLVTDETVGALYGERVHRSLEKLGWKVRKLVFPSGERAKSLANVEKIWETGFDHALDRSSIIFALGGGVIGDLAGFAAATYMRGIPFVIIPTTLLAMVDSSLGGKVGINREQGKNLVGSFHQPEAVLAFISTLASLDRRNLAAGWAEVVKSALIGDPPYYDYLVDSLPSLEDLEVQAEAVFRSAKVKARIVSQDETERGLRKQLNLGHTLGHGIEQALGYGTWLHGEAVSLGLVAAAWMAQRLELAETTLLDTLIPTLAHYGLPVEWPQGIEVDSVVAPITLDKKNQSGQITLILPLRPGRLIEERISESDYRQLIKEFRGDTGW